MRGTLFRSVAAFGLLATLAGCVYGGPGYAYDPYDPGQRAATGGLLGAGTGAAIGGLAGGGRGAAVGALAGGALGASAGAATTPPPPAYYGPYGNYQPYNGYPPYGAYPPYNGYQPYNSYQPYGGDPSNPPDDGGR